MKTVREPVKMVGETLRAVAMVALVGLFMSCGNCGEVADPPIEFPDVVTDRVRAACSVTRPQARAI